MVADHDAIGMLARFARRHMRPDGSDGLAGFAQLCTYAGEGEAWAVERIEEALQEIGSRVTQLVGRFSNRDLDAIVIGVMRSTETRRPEEIASGQ